MTLREKIIETALKEEGVVESPANSNKVKYNDWFYAKVGYAEKWCGTFVSWVFAQVGIPLGVIDYFRGYAGCPYAVKHISKFGRLVTVPLPGDIAFFDFNGDGNFEHTGIFRKDLGNGLFQCIEGNTGFGNDSNGGKVMVRSDRKYKHAIFVRPRVLEELELAA